MPLVLLSILIGGLTVAQAFIFEWLPDDAAEQAGGIKTLFWFVFWVSVVVFTIVTVVVVYSAFRFRAKPGDDSDGPPVHGNTKLEVVWTLVPAIILAVVGFWAYLVLADNEALAEDRVAVDVVAEQFAWTFRYPGTNVESGDLRVPVGRQLELRMRARDVIHDLYVPEFYVKQDVVPGITTRLIVNPERTGTFPVVCAELCGLGHNTMRAQVIVMEPAAYDAWLAQAQRTVSAGPDEGDQPEREDAVPGSAGRGGGAETPEGIEVEPDNTADPNP